MAIPLASTALARTILFGVSLYVTILDKLLCYPLILPFRLDYPGMLALLGAEILFLCGLHPEFPQKALWL